MAKDLVDVKLISHDIVEVTLKEKLILDTSVTDKIDQMIQQLAPDRKIHQLVMAQGPYVVDPEMRNAVTHGETGVRQLSIAWISPDEKANQEQEAIVSKLPLPFPIRFFSKREEGLAWLRSRCST